tara:strand:+ start:1294 stop:1830 length:537 start_codon:yes stop_codon:yes gene_type:complete
MKVTETNLLDCKIIEPEIFGDDRGFFLETFQLNRYRDIAGIELNFVQDNYSRSEKNVLRGLHFQIKKPQGKLVRVVKGEVLDVAVDLRKDSKSFGNWTMAILNEDNKKQLWIPPGMAHGFLVLSDFADFEYKCTDYYHPEDEGCIIWNDSTLNIDWNISHPILSNKDSQGLSFNDFLK